MADLNVKAGNRQNYVGSASEDKPTENVTPGSFFEEISSDGRLLRKWVFGGGDFNSAGQYIGGDWYQLATDTEVVERLEALESLLKGHGALFRSILKVLRAAHGEDYVNEDDLDDDELEQEEGEGA